jgi:hypothetical protein
MISSAVIGTAKFLRMPVSSRELYFQLNVQADDDGVVEAFTVMKMTGATEDDLLVLSAKDYVTVLDKDELIVWIADWLEHNQIRQDRLIESRYRELLQDRVPGIVLLESTREDANKSRVQRRRRYSQPDAAAAPPRTVDGAAAGPPPRLVEDSVGKDSLGKEKGKTTSKEVVPASPGYERWMAEFKEALGFAITKEPVKNQNAVKAICADHGTESLHNVLAYLSWVKKNRKAKERPHWFQYTTSFIKVRNFWDNIQAAMTDDAFQEGSREARYADFFNR